MSELIKVKVVRSYWYLGNYYTVGEELLLPLHVLEIIGMDNFMLVNKMVTKPYKDKMIRNLDNK